MKGFFSALLLSVITVAQASTTPNIPAKKGEACTFQEGVRYSELVINSRINDFKANLNASGFGVFDDQGAIVQKPNNTKKVLDYVPGLVAKAILETVDYYKNSREVNV